MKYLILSLVVAPLSAFAQDYTLKVTNGANMPLSPAIVYVSKGSGPYLRIGQTSTPGFTQLCQTGNTETRFMEVQGSDSTVSAQKSSGLLMPGQSVEFTVSLGDPSETVQFESMYGKTKDACAVFSVSAKSLMENPMRSGRDEVVATGSFLDPRLPMNHSMACQGAASAVDCLRTLASATNGKVRFFPGYLPSVLNFLEKRFGAEDAQSLVIPTSGAVRYEIQPLN